MVALAVSKRNCYRFRICFELRSGSDGEGYHGVRMCDCVFSTVS